MREDMRRRARAELPPRACSTRARQLVGRAALHLPVLRDRARHGDGVQIAVPGFQPFAAYDVVLANLVPGLDRREPPASVLEVLEWAGEPLATREVAVVCDIDHDEAREQLGRVADEEHVGVDGLWSAAA